ncbi:uncharacterized protein LOC142235823 [Haematobia irritans]|uniref:uncharacterized protein LOC142235823 n=1 Tax=Haematobia irritans TaxID=7368 RepID=UPI003F4FDADA
MDYQKLMITWGFVLMALTVCASAKRDFSIGIIGVFYNISKEVTSIKKVNVSITSSKVISLNVSFNEDINKAPGEFSLNMISKAGRRIVIFQFQSEICRILEEGSKNIFISIFMKEFLRKSNLPQKCPIRKNVEYYVKNYTVDENSYPPYLPTGEYHFNLKVKPNNIGTMSVSMRAYVRKL